MWPGCPLGCTARDSGVARALPGSRAGNVPSARTLSLARRVWGHAKDGHSRDRCLGWFERSDRAWANAPRTLLAPRTFRLRSAAARSQGIGDRHRCRTRWSDAARHHLRSGRSTGRGDGPRREP